MADNIKVQAGTGNDTVAPPCATDDIGGVHYPKIKVGWGADGVWNETAEGVATRFPFKGVYEGVSSMTVANGATVSTVVDLAGYRTRRLIIGSAFDGTTITFQVSSTELGTYVDLYDITNTQVSMTVAASRAYDLPGELMSWRFIKIVCGTVQATTDTSFTWVLQS